MRALLSLLAGAMMLNLGAHAGSSTKATTTDGIKALDEDIVVPKNPRAWEKQEMEDESENAKRSGDARGFERNPRPYNPQRANNHHPNEERVPTAN